MASARDIENRLPITIGLLMATVMNTLDTTIANIALPHMQGTFSATQDQMVWVLTSYIVATAIMTPLTSWLVARIGQRELFLCSIAGFTVASMLCGSATSLSQMVLFRVLQGAFGASMMPLSQMVMLDIYPPHLIGQGMAIWGAGTTMGPVLGPLIGGWLTDNFSWRWVFYINVPVGVAAFVVIWMFMSPGRGSKSQRLDFLGFAAVASFVFGLQLVLDRGPSLDWFSSPEVMTEAVVAGMGLYFFVVQMLTAKRPFYDHALFLDRNFVFSTILAMIAQGLLFSTMALQPPLMQGLMGYPVFDAGMLMVPRSLGVLVSIVATGNLSGRVDVRFLLATGMLASAFSMLQMSHFDLTMPSWPFVVTGFIQGTSVGLITIPTMTVAFSTLDPSLRSEGTAAFALLRTTAQSVGISLMEALYTWRASVAHSDLAARVEPSNPAFAASVPAAMNPTTTGGMLNLNTEITRQASMVGYIDVFHFLCIGALVMIPLIFLVRPPKSASLPKDIVIE